MNLFVIKWALKGPLHECSIYDNELAGKKLRAMLSLGQSQEWQVALEALTGTRSLSGKSMLNYYQTAQGLVGCSKH